MKCKKKDGKTRIQAKKKKEEEKKESKLYRKMRGRTGYKE